MDEEARLTLHSTGAFSSAVDDADEVLAMDATGSDEERERDERRSDERPRYVFFIAKNMSLESI